MKIKNPTKSTIEVQIGGRQFVLPAEGELTGVSPEVALYWKEKLHAFIQVSEDSVSSVKIEAEPKVEEKVVTKAKATK